MKKRFLLIVLMFKGCIAFGQRNTLDKNSGLFTAAANPYLFAN